MSLVSDILQILTLDCRQSSLLLSESIDRPLRKSEKIALRMHTIGCWSCRRLKRQIMFIHEAARRVDGGHRGSGESEPAGLLTPEARQRMKSALRREDCSDGDP